MSRQLELSFRNNTCKSKEKAINRKCKTMHTRWAKWFLLYLIVLVVNNKIFIHQNTSIIIRVYMKFALVMTIIESILLFSQRRLIRSITARVTRQRNGPLK
jgi:hypothetical protein